MVLATSSHAKEAYPLAAQSGCKPPLLDAICAQIHKRYPIICHINADTSWLLLLPYPSDSQPANGRKFFKLLIDPWFTGTQVDYFPWFSVQSHVIPSAVKTIAELEAILRSVEEVEKGEVAVNDVTAAAGSQHHPGGGEDVDHHGATTPGRSPIDAVICCHEFTDHCHRETLTQLSPSVPIITNLAAAKSIRSWRHFAPERVHVMPPFTSCTPSLLLSPKKRMSLVNLAPKTNLDVPPDLDWRLATCSDLPNWLAISRLLTPGDFPQKGFHAGVLIAFRGTTDEPARSQEATAVVYSPHGLTADAVAPVVDGRAKPAIHPLLLMHGAVKIWLAGGMMPLNFGGENGEQVARKLGVRFWLGTHEEEKKAGGGISFLLRRRPMKVPEKADSDTESTQMSAPGRLRAVFRALESGEVMAIN